MSSEEKKVKIVGGKKVISQTLSLRTVESEISVPLERVQKKYKNLLEDL